VRQRVASAPDSASATARWRALGTTALLLAPAEQMSAARRAVEAELEAIDSAASRFRPNSELSRLNRAAGSWTAVSPLLLQALALGIRAAALTGGAVDPTLGGELHGLGYDRDFEQLDHLPATRPLQRAIAPGRPSRRSRWAEIELCQDPPSARLPAGAQIDLGATAKALAADRAAAAAHTATGTGVLVSLGGDISTAGDCLAGGWPIHVTDDHRSDASEHGQTITICDGGLATSSLVVRRWEHEGRGHHHILDPETGWPVDPYWRTASVAAGNCADANIASTAALVLRERAPAWLAEHELPARLVTVGGAVELLGGWPA
jgi:FAD:protein FMN transferase